MKLTNAFARSATVERLRASVERGGSSPLGASCSPPQFVKGGDARHLSSPANPSPRNRPAPRIAGSSGTEVPVPKCRYRSAGTEVPVPKSRCRTALRML